MSLAAYQRVREFAETPRATEYRLLGDVTAEMVTAWERGYRGAALMPALHRNREMWSTFAAVCGSVGNDLPDPLRASIISISLWVDRFTSQVIAGRELIEPLLDVNRSVRDGLAGSNA